MKKIITGSVLLALCASSFAYKQNSLSTAQQLENSGEKAYLQHRYIAAFRNYLSAARMGNSEAQLQLGGMYMSGQGVMADYVEAYAWINTAIANGIYTKTHENLAYQAKDTIWNNMGYSQQQEATNLAHEYFQKYKSDRE